MSEGILISKICSEMNLEFIGLDVKINGLNLIGRKSTKTSLLSYVTNKSYKERIDKEKSVMALIVPPDLISCYSEILSKRRGCLIESLNPEKSFYEIHDFLVRKGDFYKNIVSQATISKKAFIHPSAIIEDGVIIEDNVRIGAFTLIKSGSIIRHDAIIGNNTIIGGDGFQVLRFDGIPCKVKHCGGVLIENNVEVGDYCAICNTIFDSFTYIGSFSKIDNYCQIAHYCTIGNNVIITPNVTLTGGVVIEDNCFIGAGAIIKNKIIVKKGATVGIGSVVMHNVKEGCTVFGNPAKPIFYQTK